MTHKSSRPKYRDPVDLAIAEARVGIPGLAWERPVTDEPAMPCSEVMLDLLCRPAPYACTHIVATQAADGSATLPSYMSLSRPGLLLCGTCVPPEEREALRHPEEGLRTCECCGETKWTAGVAFMQYESRTVLGWLCPECAEVRTPISA